LNRVFLTTPFLALEIVPKATFNREELELSFYERYMASASSYRGLKRLPAPRRRDVRGLPPKGKRAHNDRKA